MHSSFFQLGHFHVPIFGLFAALGLMAALSLSQRTACYAELDPERVWNAGMTAIVSAFVISRLLLIIFNLHSFLQYPLLILALPSLTTTGVFLTAIFMLGYIRWRNLPLLPLLDAASPCAGLLWASLSLGRIIDGTRDGMPTRLPWGVREPISGAVHPVEMYAFLAATLLCLGLFRLLQTRYVAGQTTAIGLVASGLAIFFIDFFRLPSELFDRSPLEGSQIIGIAMILVGAALLMRARTQVKRESGNEPPHAI